MLRRALVISSCTLALAGCRPHDSGETTPPPEDRPATPPPIPADALASVGEVVVPLRDFDTLVTLRVAHYTQRVGTPDEVMIARFRRALANRLAHQEQLMQACRAANILVETPSSWQLGEIAGKPMAEYVRDLGETVESFQALTVAELCERGLLGQRIAVTEAEIEAHYRRHTADVIAVDGWVRVATAVGPAAAEGTASERSAAKREAKRFRTEASKPGADFETLAAAAGYTASVDALFVARDGLAPAVRDALAKLKPGQTSQPFLADGSWRVVQLLEAERAGALPFARAHDTLKAELHRTKLHAARIELRAELDRRYPVRFYVELGTAEPGEAPDDDDDDDVE